MTKNNFSIRLGNKLLTLEDDGQADDAFKKDFVAVSKTNPASLQEFFERLVELQKSTRDKKSRTVKIGNEKRGNKKMH
ncbi:hypothetical protein [Niastella sp. OAS944]|uniref:hypothetical protein n=1 Tax=Niastella sp. OAS944 TaxID=2664089 RepID=UPI003485B7D4|nr:hypothetical protein [Chitinophagaceae bacterium OAS944]